MPRLSDHLTDAVAVIHGEVCGGSEDVESEARRQKIEQWKVDSTLRALDQASGRTKP